MDEKERQQITEVNEKRVRQWFETSGFRAIRLDRGNPKGKRSDWKFTKDTATILCEVKTIFSGGQRGKNKEYAYARFETEIKDDLLSDSNVNRLGLSTSILIDSLYVPYGDQRRKFIDFLKESLRTTGKTSYPIRFEYSFTDREKAFVVIRPTEEAQLEVGFMRGGSDSNYQAFHDNIRAAVSQITQTASSAETEDYIPLVALVSESRQLRFHQLLSGANRMYQIVSSLRALTSLNPLDRCFGAQLTAIKSVLARYNLLDWAFAEYGTNLAAILLLETYQPAAPSPTTLEEMVLGPVQYDWVDCAYLLTNPCLASHDLQALITTPHVRFVEGIEEQTHKHLTTSRDRLKQEYPCIPV